MLAFSSLCTAGQAGSWDAVAATASRLGLQAIECLLPGPGGLGLPSRRIRLELGVRPVCAGPLPARFAGVEARAWQGAAASDPAVRERAVAALQALAAAAAGAGIPVLSVPACAVGEADRTAALDALCRTLHAVTRAQPDLRVALAGAAGPTEVPARDEVALVLSDVNAAKLGYWHDVSAAEAAAVAGGPAPTTWLPVLGDRCWGVVLSDHDGTTNADADYLPPGTGRVDWRALRDDAPHAALRVLRIDPRFGDAAWNGALRCLEGAGLT